MKQINRLLFFFILLLVFIIGGMWQALQSERFARIVSERVTKILSKKTNINLSFNKVEIKLFPPATILKDVKLDNSKIEGTFEAESLGFYFGILDFFLSEISIDTVRVFGGSLKIKIDLKETKPNPQKPKINLGLVLSKYQQILFEKLPVKIKNIQIFESEIGINKDYFEIDRFHVTLYENQFSVSASFFDLYIHQMRQELDKYKFDSIETEFDVSKVQVDVKKLTAKSRMSSLNFFGKINLSDDLEVKGQVQARVRMSDVIKRLNFKINDTSGWIDINASVEHVKDRLSSNFILKLLAVESDYAIFDRAEFQGDFKDKNLQVRQAKIERNTQIIQLREKASYDFKQREGKKEGLKIKLSLDNVHTNHALHHIREDLNMLKGYMSGDLDVLIEDKAVSFHILSGMKLKNLRLRPGKDNILINEGVSFAPSHVILKDGKVLMSFDILFPNSRLKAVGKVDNGVEFKIRDSIIDLERFGPIASVDLKGLGPVNLDIIGRSSKIVFDVKSELNGFSVLGYNFGSVKSEMKYDLKKNQIQIRRAEGSYNKSKYVMKGLLDFNGKGALDISANFIEGTYQDSLYIYKPLVEVVPQLPKELDFSYSSKFKLTGALSPEGIKVSGNLEGKNVRYYLETADQLKMNFEYIEGRVELSKMVLLKNKREVEGRFFYNGKEEYLEYNIFSNGLRLRDFNFYALANLGVESFVNFSFMGKGKVGKVKNLLSLNLSNSQVEGYNIGDSFLKFESTKTNSYIKANLIGGDLRLDANLDHSGKNSSLVDGSFITASPQKILMIISKRNVERKFGGGKVDVRFSSKFNMKELEKINAKININDLVTSIDHENFRLSESKKELLIEEGLIKKWQLEVTSDKGANFSTVGTGGFGKKLRLVNDFNMNANLLSLVFDKIESANGYVGLRHVLMFENEKINSYFESKSKDLEVKMNFLPKTFKGIDFEIVSEDNNIHISRLRSDYGGGELFAKGRVELLSPIPKIDVEVTPRNIVIPFFNKSRTFITGRAKVHGETLPYKVSGDLSISKTEIKDDVEDLVKSTSKNQAYLKYLPEDTNVFAPTLFDLNVRFRTTESIIISNSFALGRLNGSGFVTKSLLNPVIVGDFDIAKKSSKLVLRGHDFVINDGRLRLSESNNEEKIDLTISSQARIKDYDVFLNVRGAPAELDVGLKSNPPLDQNDILSLLTLGVTSSETKNLEDSDRESVTQLGLGSLLFDQLKLNKGFDSSLGLKLSVAPDIREDETSLLQGRSGTINNSAARNRSRTKVKVRKKINEKVDLSVSSTLGDEVDQNQEMNINYNINNNVSLEGVYEIRSQDEEIEPSSESVGADIKYKWSF